MAQNKAWSQNKGAQNKGWCTVVNPKENFTSNSKRLYNPKENFNANSKR